MSPGHAARFRALHRGPAPLVLPNAWDFASAAALAEAGFPAVGTTSLGVNAAHGLPDAAGAGRAAALALARLLTRLPCPVTVDIEDGFSPDPADVATLAAELAAAGVVGINLEDGRGGGVLADPAGQAVLIRAVRERVPGLFVNARIDTHWARAEPADLAETLARAERYVTAGADGVFVPGLSGADEIRAVAAAVPVPLNVLFDPSRHTLRGLARLGVRRVSTGSLLFRAALHATVGTALAVRDGTPLPPDLPAYADTDRLARTWGAVTGEGPRPSPGGP
ncbi:2-methylisocitrate lyase-like PEP mutase family enzyme [Prauserella shujinwangii]|uniref:2-methylisocitrate lyase-like PEP mutase family enzyme n=1 Tax=Prauserella shujinwangii TaxID=1453103 RepID=A0A2T0LR62_9PSEU|nr:isocitrate lyase/phosphoenolpyruvate mutase family protein [Prauserella shujinwangii]PRX45925.1 2-methylisocitrate lyase-like PEP mutase family enzyme [Prauserella shujinwangii]